MRPRILFTHLVGTDVLHFMLIPGNLDPGLDVIPEEGSSVTTPLPSGEQKEDTQKEQSQEVEEPAKVEGHEVTLDREEAHEVIQDREEVHKVTQDEEKAHKVTQDREEPHEVTQEREEPHVVTQDKKEKMNLLETAQIEELEESGEQVYIHTCTCG